MKFKKYLPLAIASLVMVACNNEEIPTNGIDGENGGNTWAAFSIQLPKTTGTRAADATNATAAETEVKTVALYIEQNGHLNGKVYNLSDFSSDAANDQNVYKAKIAVQAEEGSAKVWVVVNPTTAMHQQIMASPANEAFHTAFTTTVTKLAGGYSYATETDVTNSGFVMANKETKNVTLVAVKTENEAVNNGNADDNKNHFVINVERAVAKVAVINKKATLAELNSLPEQGDFSDIKYYVSQVNTETFMARKTDATAQREGANIITPGNDHDGTGTVFGTKIMDGNPLPINGLTVSGSALNSIYVLENSMLNPFEQNATHAVIVATWTPKTLYQADGNTPFTSYTTGDNFWFYNSRYYGEEPAECAAGSGHADAGKGDTYKWTKGKCYYRVYLYDKYTGDAKFHDVVRNTIYNVNIASIKAPGSNSDVPPVGPTPIPEDVWVTANVDILPWSSASMDDVDLH